MNKAAAIYCRVSTDNQEREGTSLDTQRAGCLKYAREHEYTVTNQFIETFSGLTLERPELEKLRHLVRQKQLEVIIIYCLDRISRNPTHGVVLLDEFEKCGVKLEAVTEDIDNTELGKLISYIRQYAASVEAEKIRERTGRGIRSRVLDKGKPVTYRRAPFGYNWEKIDNIYTNRLVPNNDYTTAKTIYKLSLDGKSYDSIITEFKKRGILSPDGLPEWNKHTISQIICNPVYSGMYHAFRTTAVKPEKKNGGKRIKSSTTRLSQDKWHYIPEINVVDPIITQDERAILLDRIQTRRKLSMRNANHDYLLRGLIYCETHKGKGGEPRRFHGRPKTNTFYYVCPGGKCVTIPGPTADVFVKLFVSEILVNYTPDDFYKLLGDNDKKRDYDSEQKQLEKDSEKITNKIAKLEDSRIEGDIDPEVFQRLKAQYNSQKQVIKDRQNTILDDMAKTEFKKAAVNSWLQLRERFEKRLRAAKLQLSREQIESGLKTITKYIAEVRKEIPGLNEGIFKKSKYTKSEIHELAGHITQDMEDSPEPMTTNEWRELLTACKFRWNILAGDSKDASHFRGKGHFTKILRRTNIRIDLPISSPEIISKIAIPVPGNALHNQQYYPIVFTQDDIIIGELAGKGST